MEESAECFKKFRYKGLYRDNGLGGLEGKWSKQDVANWLKGFQSKVNDALGSDRLQFTVDIWGANKEDGTKIPEVKIMKKEYFPFLDIEMFWAGEDLNFRVHLKENQKLKYLNRGSQHTKYCFNSIPSSQIRRWALLTSRTAKNENTRLDVLYPTHAEALRVAELAPKVFPTLGEVLDDLYLTDEDSSDDDSSVTSSDDEQR